MKFDEKVVWITGASSGIGRHLALAFAREGAMVAASARRMDELERVVAEIHGSGGKAAAFFCDVAKDASIKACADAVVEKWGRIDVAIANAGFGVVGKLESLKQLNGSANWQ